MKAVGLFRFYKMGLQGYLATNVCYPSRKGKENPEGNLEVSRAATPPQVQSAQASGLEGTGRAKLSLPLCQRTGPLQRSTACAVLPYPHREPQYLAQPWG